MNNEKIRIFSKILGILFVSSYLLNFIWESIHAVLLYEGHNIPVYDYFIMMSYVSTIDGLLIVIIYLIISLILKDLFWMKKLENAGIYLFAFVGVVIAAIIEFDALYLRHKWHYNALMPTVLGLGISPLLQLSITGILNVLIVKRLLKL
ncbi:hypothetical protein J4418_04825 [Candidatus Woesearchaeota archaeon]|nr:hypothetical protein [Candidatus Woesearchaeota archaeon]